MEIERILALAQYLDIEYCYWNEQYLIGISQQELDKKEEELLLEDLERHEIDEKLQEFIDENSSGLLEDEITNEYDNTYKYGREEYLVLTDSEADTAAYDSVYSIWEDCYLTEDIKKQLGFLADYIDLDSATNDAIKTDGRGHTLASYDGEENEVIINEDTYYIYRTN